MAIDVIKQYENFQIVLVALDKCTLAELKIIKEYIDCELDNK